MNMATLVLLMVDSDLEADDALFYNRLNRDRFSKTVRRIDFPPEVLLSSIGVPTRATCKYRASGMHCRPP